MSDSLKNQKNHISSNRFSSPLRVLRSKEEATIFHRFLTNSFDIRASKQSFKSQSDSGDKTRKQNPVRDRRFL